MRNKIPLVFFAFALLILTPHKAPAQQGDWVRLHAAGLDSKMGTQTLSLPDGVPRIRAVRIVALTNPIVLSRLVVNYVNGQVHYEDRVITLRQGEQTGAIDERQEARVVSSVDLTFLQGQSIPDATRIEIWGLSGDFSANSDLKFRGAKDRRFVEVPVFYGTTRNREKDRKKDSQMLATFSGEIGRDLTLGRSVVTVPVERALGSIPRPMVVARIPLRGEDPNRDFTIASVEVMEKDRFVAEMKKQLASSKRYKGQAFVFVHGYNVSFDDAIFRTAQIAHDIQFDGPAVTFSWPSRGGTWDYVHDINTAKASREGLRMFLEIIARDADVDSINLIAHSMGNDPVIEVLRAEAEIALRGGRKADFKLNEIILAAPDVSRNFFEQFAAKLAGLARGGVTLYASRNDLAMSASKRVSSGLARAGDVSNDGIVVVAGIESIDISEASTSFLSLNHSTFAEREHLVTDVRYLFERTSNKHPPHVRYNVYRPEGAQPKLWWRYKKD